MKSSWKEMVRTNKKNGLDMGLKEVLVTDVFNLASPCFMSIQASAGVLSSCVTEGLRLSSLCQERKKKATKYFNISCL